MKIKMIIILLMIGNTFVFAQGDLGAIGTTLSKIETAFYGFGVTVATLAFMWVGYKMLFRSAHWEDVASVFLGAIMIASAALLAGLLFG